MSLRDGLLTGKQLSDEELAAQAQAGSRRCFEELVHRYAQRLFYYLRPKMSTRQDTEDLVQETFLKAFRNIGRYDVTYKFSTWIYTAASRLLISFYRKKRIVAHPVTLEDSWPDPPDPSNPQEEMFKAADAEDIWAIARTLQPNQYQALWLRYMEDLSLKEVAGVMKKNQVHIRVLLHRARLNLIKHLNPAALPGKLSTAVSAKENLLFL